MTKPPARWRDLGVRLLSALVMIAVTIAALMGGQIVWGIYVYAIYCVMIWELMPLCDPNVAARHRRALAPLPMLFPLLALGLLVAGLSTPDETQPPGTAPGGLFYGGYIAGTIALIAPLVAAARAAGVEVITGAEVIALQAAEQFERYTGVRPTPEQIAEASRVSRA